MPRQKPYQEIPRPWRLAKAILAGHLIGHILKLLNRALTKILNCLVTSVTTKDAVDSIRALANHHRPNRGRSASLQIHKRVKLIGHLDDLLLLGLILSVIPSVL